MDTKIIKNRKLKLWEAFIPVIALIGMLAYNVLFVYNGEDDNALGGSNQFILLLGGAIAAIMGYITKVPFHKMLDEVANNIKSTAGAILILLMVGALAGTWMVSGIIPSMIYYGLQILSPAVFLTIKPITITGTKNNQGVTLKLVVIEFNKSSVFASPVTSTESPNIMNNNNVIT